VKQSKYFYLFNIIIHIIIGIGIFISDFLSKIYFVGIIAYFSYYFFSSKKGKNYEVILITCSYIVSSEVFLRMTGGTFSYEAIKYSVIGIIISGFFFNSISRKAFPYVIYLILLMPGILIASVTLGHETVFRKAVAFNLSGPVCLGLAALFCYGKEISRKVLDRITLALVLPIISTTTYLFLYNPNIKDVLSGTHSNFEASGGFGPNQVSTVLGLGAFAIIVRYMLFSKSIIEKIINLVILGLVSFRAIVTFSRGGVLAAVIIIIAFFIFYYLSTNGRLRQKFSISVGTILVAIAIIWTISSMQTLGFIDKRYANQDAKGRVKDDVTTGRLELISAEFQEFFENPFLGVGVGKIKEARFERIGINAASHNEMSRILAEHGFFGVVAFLILLFVPLLYRMKNRSNYLFFSFYLFWFLTINHSSMRIAAPAFIYGLCLLKIRNEEKPIIHRKQIS